MCKFNNLKKIEVDVEKNRAEWEQARRNGIGGSDIACILGFDKYKTNVDLWYDKIGKKKIEVKDNPAIMRGRNAELPIIDVYRAFNPKSNIIRYNCMFSSTTEEWKLINIDGTFEEDSETGILEVKTAEMRDFSKWDNGIPYNYLCQILWYMHVTGLKKTKLLLGYRYYGRTDINIREFNIPCEEYPLEQMESDIELIVTEATKFWEHVLKKEVPQLKIQL